MLTNYELMLVLNPEVDENQSKALIEEVNRIIAGQEGEISKQDTLGKRPLAYPINKFTHGNYLVTQFTMDGSRTKELAKRLTLHEDIIRQLLVKLVNAKP